MNPVATLLTLILAAVLTVVFPPAGIVLWTILFIAFAVHGARLLFGGRKPRDPLAAMTRKQKPEKDDNQEIYY